VRPANNQTCMTNQEILKSTALKCESATFSRTTLCSEIVIRFYIYTEPSKNIAHRFTEVLYETQILINRNTALLDSIQIHDSSRNDEI